MLNLAERYVFYKFFRAFVAAMFILAAIIWVTQALRLLDLVTAKGQTIIQFITITTLSLPFLAQIILPFALVASLIFVFWNLANDRELTALNTIGSARPPLFSPVMMMAVTAAIFAAFLSLYLAPAGLGKLREQMTMVHVDLVANIIHPGRFIEIEPGFTFHVKNRTGDGYLENLLLFDNRSAQVSLAYEASRGQIIEYGEEIRLIMQNGSVQRRRHEDGAISIVRFETYAFDFSQLSKATPVTIYKASERSSWELLQPPSPDDEYAKRNAGRFRAEFHDRIAQALYPFVFGAILLIMLGRPRSDRQNGAVIAGVVATGICLGIRFAGFGILTVAAHNPVFLFVLYAVPLTGFAVALLVLLRPRIFLFGKGGEKIKAPTGRL